MRYEDNTLLRKYNERMAIYRLVPQASILNLIGNMKDLRILDLGCGEGSLCAELNKKGAHVTGIDASEKWIKQCVETHGQNKRLMFRHLDGSNLEDISDTSFDIVVMNMVLLNVTSFRKVKKILREIARVLKPGGRLIFSDLHPLTILHAEEPNRHSIIPPTFSYFENGSAYSAVVNMGNGDTLEFSNSHWTIEAVTTELEKQNLPIYKIVEPHYDQNAPVQFQNLKQPEYILYCCRKV